MKIVTKLFGYLYFSVHSVHNFQLVCVFSSWRLSQKNVGVYIFASTLYTDQFKKGHSRPQEKNSSYLYFCFHNVHNLNQPPEKAQDKIKEVYEFLLPQCTQISFWSLNNEDEILTKKFGYLYFSVHSVHNFQLVCVYSPWGLSQKK